MRLRPVRSGGFRRLRPLFRGYTLVEVLIATTLSLMLMAAVAQMFGQLGTSVNNSRATLETAERLRAAALTLQADLGGVTVTMLPPRRVESNEGYFELIEGSSAAPKPVNSITGSNNDSSFTQTGTGFGTVGEMGDILMFTTRNSNRPFTGSFQPSTTTSASTIQSETAEVAWFVRGHNLYRRVLLVAPGVTLTLPSASGFYKQNDISVHLQGSNVVPNTLGDLTRRECRFGHDANAWPYKCNWGVAGLPTLRDNTAPGATPTTYATTGGTADYWNQSQPFIWLSNANSATGSFGDGTCTRVDDIILTNVIGFDVKVWDPGALAYVDSRGPVRAICRTSPPRSRSP